MQTLPKQRKSPRRITIGAYCSDPHLHQATPCSSNKGGNQPPQLSVSARRDIQSSCHDDWARTASSARDRKRQDLAGRDQIHSVHQSYNKSAACERRGDQRRCQKTPGACSDDQSHESREKLRQEYAVGRIVNHTKNKNRIRYRD